MSKPLKKEKRRWTTTIISAVVAVISFCIAIFIFRPDLVGILATVAFGAFGVLAAVTAIEGKPKTLRWLFDSFFNLP